MKCSKANFSKVGFGCFSSLDFVQITITIFWGELKKVLNSGMEHITVAVSGVIVSEVSTDALGKNFSAPKSVVAVN